MNRKKRDHFPDYGWRAVIYGLIILLFSILILAGLIASGAADPQPIGELIIQDDHTNSSGWEFDSQTTELEMLSSGFSLSLMQANTESFVRSPYKMTFPGSLESIFSLSDTSRDAAFGLSLQDSDSDYTIFAINSNGYYAIFEIDDTGTHFLKDWQRFPHITSDGPNSLRIDSKHDGDRHFLINNELAFESPYEVGQGAIQIGYYLETFNTPTASARYQDLIIWQD